MIHHLKVKLKKYITVGRITQVGTSVSFFIRGAYTVSMMSMSKSFNPATKKNVCKRVNTCVCVLASTSITRDPGWVNANSPSLDNDGYTRREEHSH